MRGFVFDLDNTLYDRYGTLAEILQLDYEKIKGYINPGYNMERCIRHFCHTESLYVLTLGWEGVYQRLIEEHFFNADCCPTYKMMVDYYYKRISEVAVPLPSARGFLEKLRQNGYKTGLLTNGNRTLQYKKLDRLGLESCFDVIVCASPKDGDIRFRKPEPEAFSYMADRLGVPAEQLYYVGDHPVNDVRGSRMAGYVPVWIRSQSPWPLPNDEIPAYSFDDISGLETLLNR